MNDTELANEIFKINSERGSRNFYTGYAFEFKVLRKYKKRADVLFAHRTAGSHGLADIVVQFKTGKQWLISCKNNGYWHPTEISKLRKAKEFLNQFQELKLAYYISPKRWKMSTLK